MAAEASRSSPSPDSYIGSLISLTSKSEIRYEGILDNINTEESSIGLRNVRSFGTEGRKKDGHQIPAGDKIYEYILFRGSDIKDLQVKASAPVQTGPTYNDPAIIQSNYPRPPAAPSHFPSLGTGPTPELGSISGQMGIQRPTFQGNLNPYPTGGNLGSWGPTPSPLTANGSGLAVPMYWPGYYAPPGGLPHVQQPPLLRPLPGLAMPPMQQMSQFQGMNASLSSGFSSYPDVLPLFPPVSSNLSLNSASLPSTVAPIQLTSTAALSQAMPFSLEMSQVSVANKVLSASLPAVTPSVSLPTVPHLTPGMETLTSLPQNMHKGPPISLPAVAPTGSLPPVPHLSPGMEILTSLPQNIPSIASGKPKVGPITPSPPQTESQSTPILGSSSSNQADTPFSLVTPGLLIQPTHSLEKTSIDIDIKSSENKSKPLLPGPPAPEQEAKTKPAAAAKEPILPLPRQSYHKPNGAISGTHENNRGRGSGRGRGRGTGYPRPQQARFTEDFDFMAMNEKFNKDEVWGHLGKNRFHSNIRDEDDEADGFEEDNAQPPKLDIKPVYVKDDFFDTLSCNPNDQTSNGRIKFSEQLKIDTETFGNFSRHRALYGGGRGRRGGRGRGSYQGRGYGYSGRGRSRGA